MWHTGAFVTTLNNTRQCFYQSKTVDSFWPVSVLTTRKVWQCSTFKCTRYTLASISTFWLNLTLAVIEGLNMVALHTVLIIASRVENAIIHSPKTRALHMVILTTSVYSYLINFWFTLVWFTLVWFWNSALQILIMVQLTFKLHNGLCAGNVHTKHTKLPIFEFHFPFKPSQLLNYLWDFFMLRRKKNTHKTWS